MTRWFDGTLYKSRMSQISASEHVSNRSLVLKIELRTCSYQMHTVHTYARTYVYTYVRTHIYVRTYVYIRTCNVRTNVRIYTYIYIRIYIYIYIYTYTYVFIYVYIYALCFMLIACLNEALPHACTNGHMTYVYILPHCLYRTLKFTRTILHSEWAMRTHPLYSRGTRLSTQNQ
jgi:hypothetical protein